MKTAAAFWRISGCFAAFGCAILGAWMSSIWADDSARMYSVPVTATASPSPSSITLDWTLADSSSGSLIYRKSLGSVGWGSPIGAIPPGISTWRDTQAAPGVAYEYRIDHAVGSGFIASAIDRPAIDRRGTVDVLIDDRFQLPLQVELSQLRADLMGEGWSVICHFVSTVQPVSSIKSLVLADYSHVPDLKAVLIIGHVPIPYGGMANPDGHSDHEGAWPADIFYGDMNGIYTDSQVNITNANRYDPGRSRNDNVPGDGRFDQDEITGTKILAVGRVDLSGMPAFAPKTEVDLQKQYWHRDHAWRTGAIPAQPRSLVDDNFPQGYGLSLSSWLTVPLVGKGNVVAGKWWSPSQPLLFVGGYGFGKGWEPDGVGGSFEWVMGSVMTSELAQKPAMGVFTMMLASWVGDWDSGNDVMRAVLANNGYGLACVYAGLPDFTFHGMGIGGTIGDSVLLSQDPRFAYEYTQSYGMAQKHVALLGDPTLRLYPKRPPGALTAGMTSDHAGVSLNWVPSADATEGYLVYRAQQDGIPIRLTAAPLAGTTFTDAPVAPGTYTYWVRALSKTVSPSGTFMNDSLGASTVMTVNAATPGPALAVTRGVLDVVVGATDQVGRIALGQPTRLSYTFTNSGSAGVALGSPAIAAVDGCTVGSGTLPSSLAAGSSVALEVTVTPSAATWKFDIGIANGDSARSPYRWSTSGSAMPTQPVLEVVRGGKHIDNGGSDDYVYVSGQVLTYALMNSGTADLWMGGITADRLVNCTVALVTVPPDHLAAGQTANLGMVVSPTTSGPWSFRVSTAQSSFSWSVSGTASLPPQPRLRVSRGPNVVTSGSLDRISGSVAGVPQVLTYTFTNIGQSALNMGVPDIHYSNGIANCTATEISVPGATLAAGGSATLAITVTPGATNGWAFVVRFVCNDADASDFTWVVRGSAAPAPQVQVVHGGQVVPEGAVLSLPGSTAGVAQGDVYTLANVGAGPWTVKVPITFPSQANCSALVASEPSAQLAPKQTSDMRISITPLTAGPWSCVAAVPHYEGDQNPYLWSINGVAAPVTGTGSVLREYWQGIAGNDITDLTGNAAYPSHPAGRDELTSLESVYWGDSSRNHDFADLYGERIRGYITAPASGKYTFWLSGDDYCEFRVSTDENPANASLVSYIHSYTGFRHWNQYPVQTQQVCQKSDPISMQMGKRYYIEILHKEGIGYDSCSVGWLKPGETGSQPSEVVPGSALSPFVAGTGEILREYWQGIPGNSIADLTGNSAYPYHPTGSDALNSLESVSWDDVSRNHDFADHYGERIRGYITAPVTGDYTFWLSGDDYAEFRISADENPANAKLASYIHSYTGFRQWNQFPVASQQAQQKSGPIHMETAKRYYIEILHKEGLGLDHCSVGWLKPGESGNQPSEIVPGYVLSPFMPIAVGSLPREKRTGGESGNLDRFLESDESIRSCPFRQAADRFSSSAISFHVGHSDRFNPTSRAWRIGGRELE